MLPSGELLAGNGQHLYRWTAAGAPVRKVPNATCFRLVPVGGSMMLLADGSRLDVYDGETFEPTARFVDPNLRRAAHEGYIHTLAVHPCGAFVATASDDADRAVKVWELASGRLVGAVASAGTGPVRLAWSKCGTQLFATADGHVARWQFVPAAAQRFACFAGPPLEAAALVPGGRVAALGENWKGRRELLAAGPSHGPVATAYLPDKGGNGRPGVAVGADGLLAVTTQTPGITRWTPGATVAAPGLAKQIGWSPQFDPAGTVLWAVVDASTVRTYDPDSGKERARWSNERAKMVSGLASLNALAVGRGVTVAGGRDGAVYLLDPTTGAPTAVLGGGDPVLAVALTPDDALAVAGTQDGTLRVVRRADRTEAATARAHPGGVTAVSVSRDGALLATGGRDRTVRLWKRCGDRFAPLLAVTDLPSGVRAVQFDRTSGALLVLLVNEHAARVWDVDRLNAQLAELQLGW